MAAKFGVLFVVTLILVTGYTTPLFRAVSNKPYETAPGDGMQDLRTKRSFYHTSDHNPFHFYGHHENSGYGHHDYHHYY